MTAAEPVIRLACRDDIDAVLACARAFHAEDGHPLPAAGEAALAALAEDGSPHGRLVVLDVAGSVRGYGALCFGYSIEFGGRDAFIDDIYVAPPLRARGHGARMLARLEQIACAEGCRALHLEVFPGNPMSQWYGGRGFAPRGRLMSKRLAGSGARSGQGSGARSGQER